MGAQQPFPAGDAWDIPSFNENRMHSAKNYNLEEELPCTYRELVQAAEVTTLFMCGA